MSSLQLQGYVFKMNDNRWRVRIPNKITKMNNYTLPYNGSLDRSKYNIYSILSEFNIDVKNIDEKYYQYQIESDEQFIYCYALSENCARAGIADFIKKYHHSLDKLTYMRGIQYTISTPSDKPLQKEENVDENVDFSGLFDAIKGDY